MVDNSDASVGVNLAVLAADPTARVSEVDSAGGKLGMLPDAVGNEGEVIADGANQDLNASEEF